MTYPPSIDWLIWNELIDRIDWSWSINQPANQPLVQSVNPSECQPGSQSASQSVKPRNPPAHPLTNLPSNKQTYQLQLIASNVKAAVTVCFFVIIHSNQSQKLAYVLKQ